MLHALERWVGEIPRIFASMLITIFLCHEGGKSTFDVLYQFRDVLFDVFRQVGVSVKKDASFFTNPQDRRSTLKLVDVMVYR